MLLTHFDDDITASSFKDERGHTVLAVNGATTKVGGKFNNCLVCSNTNKQHVSSTSADYVLGTMDFTIEFWMYRDSNLPKSTYDVGIFQLATAANNIYNGIGLSLSGYSRLFLGLNGAYDYYGDTALYVPDNTWNHIALVRSNSMLYLYVGGILKKTRISFTHNFTGSVLTIGSAYSINHSFNGYIEDFRVTKGAARYTDSYFDVPTAPF